MLEVIERCLRYGSFILLGSSITLMIVVHISNGFYLHSDWYEVTKESK